jgi:hypothetical protein
MKESKAAGKSLCILSLGGLNGLAEFSVAHGYGQRELSNWRIVEEDRLKLLELSKEQRSGLCAQEYRPKARSPRPEEAVQKDRGYVG